MFGKNIIRILFQAAVGYNTVVEGCSVRGASNSFKIDNGAGYGLSPANERDPRETVTLCAVRGPPRGATAIGASMGHP